MALLAPCHADAEAPRGPEVKGSCDEAAAKWFKENYPAADEHTAVGAGNARYTSHFSVSKSRCFMEVVATAHVENNGAVRAEDSEIHRLIDLKTSQQVGQIVILASSSAPLICEVGDSKCSSAKGWMALIEPYMHN